MKSSKAKRFQGKGNGKLSEFYIRSGSRKTNGLCDTDPKYRMPAPPPLERWEQAGLDDIAYK